MAPSDNVPAWFQREVKSLNPDAQRLLEHYSGFAPDEVLPHALALRDEAFKVYHYACIGQMRFLSFNLPHLPFYTRVLDALRADPSAGFLDAGCCFGQELRYLADQGIPGQQLFGCDLQRVFIEFGYRLFRDKGRLDATFVAGDLAADYHDGDGDGGSASFAQTELSQTLADKIDIVFASSLFHMWDYDTQLRVAIRLVSLCRDRAGVMITGRQMGSVLGGAYPMAGMKDEEGAMHYRHNVETIKGFWSDVGEATRTRWSVEAGLYVGEAIEQTKDSPWAEPNLRMIWWCATRL